MNRSRKPTRGKKSKRWLISLLPLLITLFMIIPAPDCFAENNLQSVPSAAKATTPPELYATSAVLMDGESGRILYDRNGHSPMANASTTKIMTCILVLEECLPGEELTVSAYAASQPEVHLGMKKKDRFLVEDLLYSMMLESHNDAACALAEHFGKKMIPELSEREEECFSVQESKRCIDAFCDKMTQRAAELGCEDTCFLTPNGLDASRERLQNGCEVLEEHHTTAADLARIMTYCVKGSSESKRFLEITQRRSISFRANDRTYYCANHNRFLDMMDGVISGKTGFTGKAGYCYVAALEKDGKTLIVSLLACGWPGHKEYKWSDARKLMEYGLQNFRRENLYSQEYLYPETLLPEIAVTDGQEETIGEKSVIGLSIKDRENLVKEAGILLLENERISVSVSIDREIKAPIEKGQKLGEISYEINGEVIWTENLVADRDIRLRSFRSCLEKILKSFLKQLSRTK